MKVLYITYFSAEKPGMHFLETFNQVHSQKNSNTVDLLICYQGDAPDINFTYNQGQIILYSLDSDSQLRKWKHENCDVIPHFQGGEATKHSHPDLMCHPQNRALSKCIQQIISISHGWNSYKDQYDLMMWLDSKTFFKKPLPFDNIFAEPNINFYYFSAPKKLSITKSKCEGSLETRFMAFTKETKIIPNLISEYQKKKFRDHPVWSPPFVLKTILDQINNQLTNNTQSTNQLQTTKDLGADLPPRSRVPLLDSNNPINNYLSCQF